MRRLLVSICLVAAFAVFLLLPEERRGHWLEDDPLPGGPPEPGLDLDVEQLERSAPGPRQTIAGRVRLVTGEPTGGVPVGGVTVRLEHAWVPEVRAVTDAEGRFELAPEEPRGELVVDDEEWVFLGGERAVVEGVSEGYLLAVALPAEVSGRVLDPDGAPIAGADVSARLPADVLVGLGLASLPIDGPGRRTRSGADGGFTLGPLPDVPGMVIVARAPGFRPAERLVPHPVAPAAGAGPLDLELEPDAD